MLIPMVMFDRIHPDLANRLLVEWGHKMGPCKRPFPVQAHALYHNGYAVCVVMHGQIITPAVGGEEYREILTRGACVELCRLCAARPGLNRVGIRLWREFVFPSLQEKNGIKYAISYQDAHLHNGNTYRFDGWERFHNSRSGPDKRSGLKGRNKWLWIWPPITKPNEQKTTKQSHLA